MSYDWQQDDLALIALRRIVDAPYLADARRAEAIAMLINLQHHKEASDPTFIGPPRPKHRGPDTLKTAKPALRGL